MCGLFSTRTHLLAHLAVGVPVLTEPLQCPEERALAQSEGVLEHGGPAEHLGLGLRLGLELGLGGWGWGRGWG